MGPEDPITVATTISEGDAIEVRAMADQASSNEDVGITSLKMTLKAKQTFVRAFVSYLQPSEQLRLAAPMESQVQQRR